MRGRIPKPWFWSERDCWYVVVGGKRVALDREKKEAYRKYHELMAQGAPDGAAPAVPAPASPVAADPQPTPLRFDELVTEYLNDMARRVEKRTHYVAACYLQPIREACGKLPAGSITKTAIDTAITRHGTWNPTTEHHVRCRVLAVFNWAVSRDLLPANPIRGLRKPRPRTRGADAVIDADVQAKLLAAAPPYLRNVLFALQQTGARPGEVLTVTAADFDPTAGVWILREHKTASQGGGVRVIHLPPAVVTLCRELAAKHATGPLFRRASGKPFPPAYYLARLVRALRRKLGMSERVIPYGFRHTFATDELAACPKPTSRSCSATAEPRFSTNTTPTWGRGRRRSGPRWNGSAERMRRGKRSRPR